MQPQRHSSAGVWSRAIRAVLLLLAPLYGIRTTRGQVEHGCTPSGSELVACQTHVSTTPNNVDHSRVCLGEYLSFDIPFSAQDEGGYQVRRIFHQPPDRCPPTETQVAVAAVPVTYSWKIIDPRSNTVASGAGTSAGCTALEAGPYLCYFLGTLPRVCAPSPLSGTVVRVSYEPRVTGAVSSVNLGESISLSFNGDPPVQWYSDDTTVATVAGGQVAGIRPGTALITARGAHDCEASLMIAVTSRIDIAMDGNRDTTIDFYSPEDKSYMFWVNDDCDAMHWHENMSQEDDLIGPPNCDDDIIGASDIAGVGCKRDLEDFTRLHVKVPDAVSRLDDVTYWLLMTNCTFGSPAVNLFEAVGNSPAYLTDPDSAARQIQKMRVAAVNQVEVQLPGVYIKRDNQLSAFLLEGKSAGKGDLTLVAKRNDIIICTGAVTIELRPITSFYQVFRVSSPGEASKDASLDYKPDFTRTDDYLLFVHGFNVNEFGKESWPATILKRLWWQGYRGHFGWFDWPCLVREPWDFNPEIFDKSERIAWWCGKALFNRIVDLNRGVHAGKVRLLAHSQGNIVAGEALRFADDVVVQAYIASQAAASGDLYAGGLPQNEHKYGQPFPTTPNVLAHFPGVDAPYLASIVRAVGASRLYNYFNKEDYALRSGLFSWERNNAMKPNLHYNYHEDDRVVDTYMWPREYFYYDTLVTYAEVLDISDERSDDRYRVFSYAAESRTYAIGTDTVPGFTPFDLKKMPIPYDTAHYAHSRQIRSNVGDEWMYWAQVMRDCGF